MGDLPLKTLEGTGRVLLASLFLLGGLNKVLNYAATLRDMAAAGLAPAEALLPVVIALEVIGGLFLIFGRKAGAAAAALLAGFTLLTNAVFHRFWTLDGMAAELHLSLFFKNISIAGGLLILAALLWSRHRAPHFS